MVKRFIKFKYSEKNTTIKNCSVVDSFLNPEVLAVIAKLQ